VVRKISLALVLATMAGVASAAVARAPEIDPASAMAGLTMLAGGLAVLRGRRRKDSQE
jgi:LPXTG-motif cell wall-anchored protein